MMPSTKRDGEASKYEPGTWYIIFSATFPDSSSGSMSRVVLTVQSEPAVDDPRELETILVSSLRALFGEWEPHSCQIRVKRTKPTGFGVECPSSSEGAVRCALVMPTTPAYLSSTSYRFDVIQKKQI